MKDLAEKRFMPRTIAWPELRIAATLGHGRRHPRRLGPGRAAREVRKTGVAGRFMPDRGVSARLASLGIAENVEEADFFKFRTMVTPYCGISSRQRRDWQAAGYPLEDLTSPQVRRAQVALGLLRMEGAQALVIGRHEDPESLAISGGIPVPGFSRTPRIPLGWYFLPHSARFVKRPYRRGGYRGSRSNSACAGGMRR